MTVFKANLRVDREQEQGFMLVGLIVAIFLILLALSVAAPKVARDLRREREVEAVHRGDQYVRAIQLYYRKTHTYPGTIEQLEKSNNIRYLRQKYVDPMTGKADWRLIHVGEAKTTVKGFFGQPLAGIGGAPGGLGSAAGMVSQMGPGTTVAGGTAGGSAFGSPGGMGTGGVLGLGGSSGPGGSTLGGVGTGAAGTATATSGLGSSSGSPGIASQSATDFTGGGAPFVGVGSSAKGDSIITLNEQTTYPTWEFIYDPRIEQLKAKASLFGGGPASASATGLGTASSMNSGIGGTPSGTGTPGAGANPGSNPGTGTAPLTPNTPQ